MNLKLGFEDYPYSARATSDSPLSIRRRRGQKRLTRAQQVYGEGKTTGEVAKSLEEKYHIVETFMRLEHDDTVKALGEYYSQALANSLEGSQIPAPDNLLRDIEKKFRTSLSKRRFDGIIPGVPTLAATRGVHHQFAHPYASARGSRPSFVDTGMYQSTFKAWVEE